MHAQGTSGPESSQEGELFVASRRVRHRAVLTAHLHKP